MRETPSIRQYLLRILDSSRFDLEGALRSNLGLKNLKSATGKNLSGADNPQGRSLEEEMKRAIIRLAGQVVSYSYAGSQQKQPCIYYSGTVGRTQVAERRKLGYLIEQRISDEIGKVGQPGKTILIKIELEK